MFKPSPEQEAILAWLARGGEPTQLSEQPWLVIDGRQRLKALFGCLSNKRYGYRLAFDVERKEIVDLPEKPRPEHLPLGVVLDTILYLRWCRDLPDHWIRVADDFVRQLRHYKIDYCLVDDLDQLADIYQRMNDPMQCAGTQEVLRGIEAMKGGK